MKLDDFITNVLTDINQGIKNAEGVTNRKYQVETSGESGVRFDIAVTTTNKTGSNLDGKLNASIIEVLGANVGGKLEHNNENSEASRISFSIFVPPSTIEEQKNAHNASFSSM
jgi:hypothetical protein